MRVVVDGQARALLLVSPPNLAAVIAEIDEALEGKGRAIKRVSVDGEDFSLERLVQEMHVLRVEEIGVLDIGSQDLRDIVDQSLVEVEGVIGELSSACHTLASLLNSDERDLALGKFQEFAHVWKELLARHRQAMALLKEDANIGIDGAPLDERDRHVEGLLDEGARLAGEADAIGLADLLGHELVELAAEEADILADLRAGLTGG